LIPPEDIANIVVTSLDRGRPGEIVERLQLGQQRSTAR
jgi:hypothetical protein